MCKTGRDRAASSDGPSRSPSLLPDSSSLTTESNPAPPLGTEEELKEWEEVRCPVCLEHPHKAVLLICSSFNNGCRPYMCNTSQRHSYCLGQYRKTFRKSHSPTPPEEDAPIAHWSSVTGTWEEGGATQVPDDPPFMYILHDELACPLCRGQVSGWLVLHSAREFMNKKTRSCACETCDFTGNYGDLRQHARVEHPEVRPTDPDPVRQNNWRQLVRQRDIDDIISIVREADEYDTEDTTFTTILVMYGVSNVRIQAQQSVSEGSSPVSGFVRRSRDRRLVVSDGEDDGSVSSVEDSIEPLEADNDEAPRALTLSWIRANDRRIRRRLDRLDD